MTSRSSRRSGASDRNSLSAMKETTANRQSVAIQPNSRAAPTRTAITHQLAIRWRRLV